MSFFEDLFHKKQKNESVVMIDIGADSVAGAYVQYEDELPAVLYTRRLPIEIRTDESHERAMLRALDLLGKDLVREGAPELARVTGSGSISLVLVSVDAPWQETKVRTEYFEAEKSFVFTRSLVMKRLEETASAPSEHMLADESIIGTILNGYETHNPYGNSVHHATVIVLTSFIKREVADSILASLRSLYHTKNILPIAGSSLRYQALRQVFPHENDAIILDATATSLLSIALVRRGTFVSLSQSDVPENEGAWMKTVTDQLSSISVQYPLPRTIFLLARESEIDAFKKMLDATNFGPLWLSDNPPRVVAVLRNVLSGSIRQLSANPADIVLLLMALYFQGRRQNTEKEI